MDSVKKSVTCQICQKLYNNPVYLPCNYTVCQCHVEEILKQKHDDPANLDIPCFLCKNSHSTQLLLNLKVNHTAIDLISSNSYLSDSEKKIKTKSILFSEELNSLFQKCINRIEKDLDFFLIDYHNDIRNRIELQRKMLIEKINKKADSLIDRVNSIEEKHRKLLTKMKQDEKLSTKLDSLNRFKIDLDAEFCQPRLHQTYLDSLNEQMKARITSFKEKLNDIEEFKNDIKCLKFEPCTMKNTNFEAFGEISNVNKFNKIISYDQDGLIKVWDLNSSICVHTLDKQKDSVNQIEIMSEHELVSCSTGAIKILNYITGNLQVFLKIT